MMEDEQRMEYVDYQRYIMEFSLKELDLIEALPENPNPDVKPSNLTNDINPILARDRWVVLKNAPRMPDGRKYRFTAYDDLWDAVSRHF